MLGYVGYLGYLGYPSTGIPSVAQTLLWDLSSDLVKQFADVHQDVVDDGQICIGELYWRVSGCMLGHLGTSGTVV